MAFELPPLPYAYDALGPYMSAETLEYHHDKHHLAYVNNGNNLLKDSGLEGKSLEEIVKESYGKNAGLFNNAGQHFNHIHFWKWMKPSGGGSIPGEVERRIVSDFGSVDKLKEDFKAAGVGQFGSGWAWLVVNGGKLAVCSTANQDSPLMGKAVAGCEGTPILGCDVWEHAYYLHYQNRRPDYIAAFWNVVNWSEVARRFVAAH